MSIDNYKDNIDIIMTALTEIRYHVEDGHYSEINPKIAIAAYSLGQLATICHSSEKIASKPIQLNAKLQASHDRQRLHIGKLEREVARLQKNNYEWQDYCAEQEAKVENLETAREQLNSSVKHGRKIMKTIGKHK